MLSVITNLIYIVSPIFPFSYQIYKGSVNYSPVLSLLTIFSNVLKIFDFHISHFSICVLYQSIFIVILHIYFYKNNKVHGLQGHVSLFVTLFLFFNNFLFFLGFRYFKHLSCLLELVTNFMQLLIYRGEVNKAKEVFSLFLIGDFCKILMNIIYGTPIIYIAIIVIQIFMNLIIII